MDAAVYQQIADLEDRHWWHVARQRIIVSLIDRFGPPKSAPGTPRPRLCDIGCGAGALLREVGERFDVTGVDTSPIARELCAKSGIATFDGTLPNGLPLKPGEFDVVVVADVLEHVREDAPSVRTLASLLKPGGILIATVPANPWMWSKHDIAAHHERRYTRRTLRAIFEPGAATGGEEPLPLRREVFSPYNCFLFLPIAVVRLIGRMLRPVPRTAEGNAAAGGSDLGSVPEPLNSLLRVIFGAERHLLGRVPLPFGVSLVAVYRKTA